LCRHSGKSPPCSEEHDNIVHLAVNGGITDQFSLRTTPRNVAGIGGERRELRVCQQLLFSNQDAVSHIACVARYLGFTRQKWSGERLDAVSSENETSLPIPVLLSLGVRRIKFVAHHSLLCVDAYASTLCGLDKTSVQTRAVNKVARCTELLYNVVNWNLDDGVAILLEVEVIFVGGGLLHLVHIITPADQETPRVGRQMDVSTTWMLEQQHSTPRERYLAQKRAFCRNRGMGLRNIRPVAQTRCMSIRSVTTMSQPRASWWCSGRGGIGGPANQSQPGILSSHSGPTATPRRRQ
jgi:hypothetical protein